MKIFILLIALVVSVLGKELSYSENSNDDASGVSPSQSRRQHDSNYEYVQHRLRQTPNGHLYVDSNGLTPDALSDLFQSARKRTYSQIPLNTMSADDSQENPSLGYWASYPDAAAFDAKVKGRLATSKALAEKPEIRQKITEIAEEKFNQCKQKPKEQERACLAHSTGQMMQLVAAVENMSRHA